MQFVLTDTKEVLPTEMAAAIGRTNCFGWTVGGIRFEAGTALIRSIICIPRSHPVIDVGRIDDNHVAWVSGTPRYAIGAEIELYPRHRYVDDLLRRCQLPKQPRIARVLQWLRRFER